MGALYNRLVLLLSCARETRFTNLKCQNSTCLQALEILRNVVHYTEKDQESGLFEPSVFEFFHLFYHTFGGGYFQDALAAACL